MQKTLLWFSGKNRALPLWGNQILGRVFPFVKWASLGSALRDTALPGKAEEIVPEINRFLRLAALFFRREGAPFFV
ncbi:hypothetical protein KSX_95220 [Ktedonospora formicarum]|uniref:Uncharacterized protein n=1 Tax=Ktedonospora formicarum TaxID=2778364 RepID=A0A8J3I8B5_9CHLR|nr:hypothetical protein KSX_95220 [Ktedonospora formicarum]